MCNIVLVRAIRILGEKGCLCDEKSQSDRSLCLHLQPAAFFQEKQSCRLNYPGIPLFLKNASQSRDRRLAARPSQPRPPFRRAKTKPLKENRNRDGGYAKTGRDFSDRVVGVLYVFHTPSLVEISKLGSVFFLDGYKIMVQIAFKFDA